MDMARPNRLLAWLGAAVLLIGWGCAALRPSLEAPRISLVNMTQLPSTGGLESAFRIDLRLINPNDRALNLKGVDCRLEINDSTIASGVAGESVRLPALGTLVYPVTLYASAGDFIMLMVRLLVETGRAPDDITLNYRLKGRLFLADSLPGLNRLTFTSEGDLLKIVAPPEKPDSD